MYVLVRHGHTRDKKGWTGSEHDRPLSERGTQQAAGIAENLHGLLTPRLLASPYLRCQQTLVPLAAKVGRDIVTSDLLAPDGDVLLLDRLLSSPEGEGAVLCTHRSILDALFALWLDQGTLEIADGGRAVPRTEKGATWVAINEDGRHTVHYQRPLHVGPPLESTGA